MKTISQLTEEVIKNSPNVEEALGLGIINLSALARKIKPEIDAQNLKKNSQPAIIMALQRLGVRLKKKNFGKSRIVLPQDIVLRSNLVEFVFENSPKFSKVLFDIVQLSQKQKDAFVNATQGVTQATIIVGKDLATALQNLSKGLKLVYKVENLSSITLRFKEDTINMPGVYYNILKALAWEGVAIAEVISAGMGVSILFEKNKVDKAFLVIKSLMRE